MFAEAANQQTCSVANLKSLVKLMVNGSLYTRAY